MRVGVLILPEEPWAAASQKWIAAERMGFDHVWTYDHLAWRSLRDSPWFGAIPTLTAAAVVTERIRLGTLVASPNFRHPVSFARELVTLDDVAGGRVTLGFGAGGVGWDATVLGQEPWSPTERQDRFAEFVELLDLLLREPEVDYEGRYYTAVDARTYPGCVQQPRLPFAIAATGPRSMAVAARRAETWVTNGDRRYDGPPLDPAAGAAVVAAQTARLDAACHAVDRDPSTIDRMVVTGSRLDAGLASPAAFRELVDAYAQVGVTDVVVHWPRSSEPYQGDPTILERILG